MKTNDQYIAEFFNLISEGQQPTSVIHQVSTSDTLWMEAAQQALDTNNTEALKVLQKCGHAGYCWKMLTKSDTCDENFRRVLAWCPTNNLSPFQKLRVSWVGEWFIRKNLPELFSAVFNHIEHQPHFIKEWTKLSVHNRAFDITKILLPYIPSKDCVTLASESVLQNLPILTALLQHMAPGDIGVSCGMIAHVEDKRDIIVKTLNSKPESWIEFYAYNNNLAQPWIEQAYAQHQNTILQQHVCPDSFSLRKSKI